MDTSQLVLGLSNIKNLGPVTFKKLAEEYKTEEVFNKNILNILAKFNVNESEFYNNITSTLNVIKSKNLKFISIFDKSYPEILKNIYDPPIILFYKGNLENLANLDVSISVVGTRNFTDYGKNATKLFIDKFGEYKIPIISGLAFGIDYYAHKFAIESKSKTIAVLPSGSDKAQPANNQKLYDDILANNGLIISEFLTSTVVPGMFLRRNRIIAGISRATLVIEAGLKSGAINTANLACNYGREVYALPGNINQEKSEGCNFIIKNGIAKLVSRPEDILVDMGISTSQISKDILDSLSKNELLVYNDILIDPKNCEDLSLKTGILLDECLRICTILEIKGIIFKNLLGIYSIVSQ